MKKVLIEKKWSGHHTVHHRYSNYKSGTVNYLDKLAWPKILVNNAWRQVQEHLIQSVYIRFPTKIKFM